MIGSIIKNRRQELGYNVRSLASKAGITHPALVAIEKGRQNPRQPTLKAICEALELDAKTFKPHPRYPFQRASVKVFNEAIKKFDQVSRKGIELNNNHLELLKSKIKEVYESEPERFSITNGFIHFQDENVDQISFIK